MEKNLERIKGEMTKLGGTVRSVRPMGLRSFARRLKNKEAGLYVNIRFDMDEASADTLRARLKLNEDIFRIQITRSEMKEMETTQKAADVVAAK
jgi:small subunit ribosomal protein S6